jgi:hypothetical protein
VILHWREIANAHIHRAQPAAANLSYPLIHILARLPRITSGNARMNSDACRRRPTENTNGNEELRYEHLWKPKTRVLDSFEIERCFYKPLFMFLLQQKIR